MSQSATLHQKSSKRNRQQEYQDLLSRWSDFYNAPLKRAVKLLSSQGYSLSDIKREVFNDQISREAIRTNYLS